MEQAERVEEPEGGYHFEPLSERVIAAAITVHKELGPGFREEVYENALCLELEEREIPFERQVEFPVHFRGRFVGTHTLDILIAGSLVVELNSVSVLFEVHHAQLTAYLRAADVRVGWLLNFGAMALTIKRQVNRYRG